MTLWILQPNWSKNQGSHQARYGVPSLCCVAMQPPGGGRNKEIVYQCKLFHLRASPPGTGDLFLLLSLQLVEKRLLALLEEELNPLGCPASQYDFTPSQSEEEDEDSSHKAPATGDQAGTSTSPPGKRGNRSGVQGKQQPEALTPAPMLISHQGYSSPEGTVMPRGTSSHECGGQGKLLKSLRNRVEKATLKRLGQVQTGGQLLRSGITLSAIQCGSQARDLSSWGKNLVGQEHLKSISMQCGKEGSPEEKVKDQMQAQTATKDDGKVGSMLEPKAVGSVLPGGGKEDCSQEEKVKGQTETYTVWEGLRDVPVTTECNSQVSQVTSQRNSLVEKAAPESTLSECGIHNGCQEEKVKDQTQAKAGWDKLSDIQSVTDQVKTMRSCRNPLTGQAGLQSFPTGCPKQVGNQEGKAGDQRQTQDSWGKAIAKESDIPSRSIKSREKNLGKKGTEKSIPIGLRKPDDCQTLQLTRLETKLNTTHPLALPVGKNGEQSSSLSLHPLRVTSANGQEEDEFQTAAKVYEQCMDPDHTTGMPFIGLNGQEEPVQAISETFKPGCQTEPKQKFTLETESNQAHLQDDNSHENSSISTTANQGSGSGNSGQCSSSFYRACGARMSSSNDGKEAEEASLATSNSSSKITSNANPETSTGSIKNAGKCGQEEDDDEELSNFSSLLAYKLHLSSPKGAIAIIPVPKGQAQPHGKVPFPSGETERQGNKRRRSMRLCPDGAQDGSLPPDPGIQHSHKRRKNNTIARRSKRLHSQ